MRRFHLDEQIHSQPAAVRAVLERESPMALDPERPILLAGEGTSLHACRVAAAWIARISAGVIRAHAVDSHTLALAAPLRAEDQLVVVSHRGSKRFPGAVLERACQAGARTVCITGEGVAQIPADCVIRTCPDETSGTHTVSYLTALAALGRLLVPLVDTAAAREFGSALARVPEAIEATLALPAPVMAAERLATCTPILVAGFDLDAITADEAALKIKEGAYLWAEGMSVEAALHGPVAVYGPGAAAIVLAPATDDGGRSEALARVCATVGMEVLHCGPGEGELAFVEPGAWLRPLVSVLPLQRLVAELARLRGSNPDRIRADQEPWGSAMRQVRL